MAQETANDLPDTISREAHQRVLTERDELKGRVTDLEKTVLDLGLTDKARRHFSEKGVDDPDWAAEIALPNLRTAGEVDVAEYLDQKFARLYPQTPATPATPAEGEPVDTTPMPDAGDAPGFARPNPAAGGEAPGQKKYRVTDPEIKALIQANDRAGLERLDKAGQIDWLSAPPVTPG